MLQLMKDTIKTEKVLSSFKNEKKIGPRITALVESVKHV